MLGFLAGSVMHPGIGRVTPWVQNDAADVGSWTIAHTSDTGNVGVVCCARSNNATTPTWTTVAWNGSNLTEVIDTKINGVGRLTAFGGWIRGGAVGTNNMVATISLPQCRDIVGMVFDLPANMPASPIGSSTGLVTNPAATASFDVTITPANAKSLIVGMVSAANNTLRTMTINSGWYRYRDQETGNGGSADGMGVLAWRIAGSTSLLTLTGTSRAGNTTDDFAGVLLEFLPP